MDYKVLKQEEMDNIVVEFHGAQERDHFTHNLNKARYEEMLPTLDEGAFKSRIQELLNETNGRIEEVEAIMTATESQLPSKDKIDAIVAEKAAANLSATPN
jgi:ferritin-like metal-binding protein YciE